MITFKHSVSVSSIELSKFLLTGTFEGTIFFTPFSLRGLIFPAYDVEDLTDEAKDLTDSLSDNSLFTSLSGFTTFSWTVRFNYRDSSDSIMFVAVFCLKRINGFDQSKNAYFFNSFSKWSISSFPDRLALFNWFLSRESLIWRNKIRPEKTGKAVPEKFKIERVHCIAQSWRLYMIQTTYVLNTFVRYNSTPVGVHSSSN